MKYVAICLLLVNVIYLGYNLLKEESAPQKVTSVPEESGVATIALLSEVKGRDERQVEVQEILDNPVIDDSSTTSGMCFAMGAFDDVTAAQEIAERLNAIDFDVELRAIDSPTGQFDYRVVLPPAPSLQDAFRRLRELKSRDIDSYVITQGEDALGISLGVFSSRDGALIHQSDLTADGYQVNIKEIPRLSRGYWIYTSEKGREFPGDTVESAKVSSPEVGISEQNCIRG